MSSKISIPYIRICKNILPLNVKFGFYFYQLVAIKASNSEIQILNQLVTKA